MMPVEYFIRYCGKYYDIGTRLKFRDGTAPWASVLEGTVECIYHNCFYIRLIDGKSWKMSKIHSLDNIILEIIEPVYYEEPSMVYLRGGIRPTYEDIFVGWMWYIVIMIVGVIFKDRLTIWIMATAIFFLWKNGFFNGGKK